MVGPPARADIRPVVLRATVAHAMYRVTVAFPVPPKSPTAVAAEWAARPRAPVPARASDASVAHRVTGPAQRRRHLGAVFGALRLQVQFHLHLVESEPRIGADVAHVEDVSVGH